MTTPSQSRQRDERLAPCSSDALQAISDEKLRTNFALGLHCFVGWTLLRETDAAEHALAETLAAHPSLEAQAAPVLDACDTLIHWQRYEAARRLQTLLLPQAAKLPAAHRRRLLFQAERVYYRLGLVADAQACNDEICRLFPESRAARINRLWYNQFSAVTLSVCMIVRDEELVLARCLDNAVQFADELIIVDTGSSDASKAIARRYTDKVYDFTWCDDFAAARNFSYEKAHGDYIMWLDADDDMEAADIARLKRLKAAMPPGIDVVHLLYTGDAPQTGDCAMVLRDRLVRRALGARWRGAIHEAIPLEKGWKILKRPDIKIYHRKLRENPPRRNIRIFEKELAADAKLNAYHCSYLCRELTVDGQLAQACQLFERLVFDDRLSLESDYFLTSVMPFYVWSMTTLRRFDQLAETLHTYRARFGGNEIVYCTLGDLARRAGRLAEAQAWYDKAVRYQPDLRSDRIFLPAYSTVRPWLGLAKVALARHDQPRAERLLTLAENCAPHNREAKLLKLLLSHQERSDHCDRKNE